MTIKMKTVTAENIRDKLSPLFKSEELQLVLLFGSLASGAVHRQSDVDIAFLFDKDVDIIKLTNDVIRLLHFDDIDIVDLNRATPLLRYSIAKNAKLLYEKYPGVFNKFYSLAFRRYIDTGKLRNFNISAIERFLESRGLS